jgi:1,4-alpha-glucan branching enzyme
VIIQLLIDTSGPDDWNRISHPLTKNQYGVWEITIPPKAPGVCAIPHDSKLKVCGPLTAAPAAAHAPQISLIANHVRMERIPAWIRRVTQDLSVSPAYEARFWNPPKAEHYVFKNERPPKPSSVRIYEAHVGISTSEHRVGTYKEFTRDMLPRIKNLGYNTIQLMAVMEHAYYACKSSRRTPRSNILKRIQPLVTRSRASSPQARVTAHRRI